MSKIKILAISPDNYGVGKFRILDPYKYLGDNHSNEFHVDITYNTENKDEVFNNYDIVVFHSFIHQLPHELNLRRIKWLQNKGIKVVMDIDDYWSVDSKHPLFAQFRTQNLTEKKFELLKQSDYITTTTDFFANNIRKKIKKDNIFVFPNSIDENEKQFISNPVKSDKVRFGWLGGSTHKFDIDLIKDGIDLTYQNFKDKVQFVLCGFDTRGNVTEYNKNGETRVRPIKPEESVWYQYEKIFTKNYSVIDVEYKNFLHTFVESNYDDSNKPYVRKWTKEISKYGYNYNNFDVSLIPLVDNEFNNNKSQLKIIEAGFHKKAVIVSDIQPYLSDLIPFYKEGKINEKGNSLVVGSNKNHKEWGKHMKKLIENPNMIEDMGNNLYEYVKDRYSLKNTTKNRIEFFKHIISK